MAREILTEENVQTTHVEYDRLMNGEEASLNQILLENPMMQFAVFQHVNMGGVLVTGCEIDEETGELRDIRLIKTINGVNSNGRKVDVFKGEVPV